MNMSDTKIEEIQRLYSFFREQKRHWKRLLKGITPEQNIIEGWIESCDMAEEDFQNIIATHSLDAAEQIVNLKSLLEQLIFIAEKSTTDDSEDTTIGLANQALKG